MECVSLFVIQGLSLHQGCVAEALVLKRRDGHPAGSSFQAPACRPDWHIKPAGVFRC
jgi:hypothetical protein